MAIKFSLNLKNQQAFAFFDSASRLHLTLEYPIGTADGVTPAIQRGLDSKKIIMLEDNPIQDNAEQSKPLEQEPTKPEEFSDMFKSPESAEEPKEQTQAPKKRGRRSKG